MIKVSVMYPNTKESTFDMQYYCDTHIPLIKKLLGDSLKSGAVDSGICGADANEEAPYMAVGHLMFESIESFQESFGPHAQEILADLPKFTNVQPQIQINEVII